MRIVFVSWRDLAHPQAGGSEIVIDRLARGLLVRGHQIALLAGGPVAGRPYPVHDLGGTYTQYLRAPLVHWRSFADWDLLVDVENGLPYFAPLWRRGPTICFVHHVHTDQWGDRFPRPLASVLRGCEHRVMPAVYRKTLFTAVSPSTAEALEGIGVPSERIRVIHNGVDASIGEAAKSPVPLFLVVTRLVPHKRVELILEAWERVRPLTGGRLVIAGDGPERERLVKRAGAGVEILGRVPESQKVDLLGSAWLLVHAAQHEGWGMVILEAAAAGTASLAMDAPGVRDAIVHEVTGELASDVDDLVSRWVALATDQDRRQRMGGAARSRSAEFGWERTVDRFLVVADEAIARRRPVSVQR